MPLTVKKHKRTKHIRVTNKKKVRRKQFKMPDVPVKEIQNQWDNRRSVKRNLLEMGLSADANETISALGRSNNKRKVKHAKLHVVEELQRAAKEPRVKKFKLPTPQALYLTYLIRKYGDNYKDMAKDPKNIYQETWKKIRHKVGRFKKLEQYQKMISGKINFRNKNKLIDIKK